MGILRLSQRCGNDRGHIHEVCAPAAIALFERRLPGDLLLGTVAEISDD